MVWQTMSWLIQKNFQFYRVPPFISAFHFPEFQVCVMRVPKLMQSMILFTMPLHLPCNLPFSKRRTVNKGSTVLSFYVKHQLLTWHNEVIAIGHVSCAMLGATCYVVFIGWARNPGCSLVVECQRIWPARVTGYSNPFTSRKSKLATQRIFR